MSAYPDVYRRAGANPERFWAAAAEALSWTKRWDRVRDDSRAPFHRWFAGGELNTCYNALDHHIDRLADDHANAARLAEGLSSLGLGTEPVETNMVWIDVASTGLRAAEFLERLAAYEVRMSRVEERVRAVTHLDISAGDTETAIDAVGAVLGELG